MDWWSQNVRSDFQVDCRSVSFGPPNWRTSGYANMLVKNWQHLPVVGFSQNALPLIPMLHPDIVKVIDQLVGDCGWPYNKSDSFINVIRCHLSPLYPDSGTWWSDVRMCVCLWRRVPVARRSLWLFWRVNWSWQEPRNTFTTLWWTTNWPNGFVCNASVTDFGITALCKFCIIINFFAPRYSIPHGLKN